MASGFTNSLNQLVHEALKTTDETITSFPSEHSQEIIKNLTSSNGTLKDIIISIEPLLTNQSHTMRSKGVKIISEIICSLPTNYMSEKEVETIFTFMNQRLEDHESMYSDVIRCFSRLLKCYNKPVRFIPTLLDSLQYKISLSKTNYLTRKLVYELIHDIVFNHDQEARAMGKNFIVALIHLIEGENHPECLMLAFNIVSKVSRTHELNGMAEDFAAWLSSYFPLDYTPPHNQTNALKRQDLVDALYDCFVSNQAFSESVMNLAIEKIESNLEQFKLDAYDCLIYCIKNYSFEKVKPFASSVWACVRMDCLVPLGAVTDTLRRVSCQALLSMSEKLSCDNLLFSSFTEDVYNDLDLAFIKIELNLYEPATILLLHATQPRLSGFLFMVSKLMATQEMVTKDLDKKISSFALIFQKMRQIHQDKIVDYEIRYIDDLLLSTIDIASESSFEVINEESALDLITAIMLCKFKLKESTSKRVCELLMSIVNTQRKDSIICSCIKTLKTIQSRYDSSIVSKVYLESLSLPTCSASQDVCLKNLATMGLTSNKSFISESLRKYLAPNSTLNLKDVLSESLMLLLDELVNREDTHLAVEYWLPLYKLLVHNHSCGLSDEKYSINDPNVEALSLQTIAKIIVDSPEEMTFPITNDLLSLCLNKAKTARNMHVREQSLRCIAGIAFVHDDGHLIPFRPKMVQELKSCLSDRKRIVRSQAVVARNAWLMVGQSGRPRKQRFNED